MAHIVLFHHVLGLTPGVRALADTISATGHTVTTPDLFDGRTFAALSDGLAHVSEIGDETLLQRAEQAADAITDDAVFAGLSFGALPAQHLLQTREAAGGLLFHGFIDPAQLAGSWPACPVAVFAMDHDPFFVEDGDLAVAQNCAEQHDNLAIQLYPGHGHLFTEPASPDHDAELTRRLVDDVAVTLKAWS